MAHIVIDARPINSVGYGRYLRNLVENLGKLDATNRYTILVWPDFKASTLNLPPNFVLKIADYPVSGSFKEQINLAWLLRGLKPDLVHFGMTQQPVLYKGKKITTIHDLTTIGFDNPAKNRTVFKPKQQVYGRLIKQVAKTSVKLITPSQYVKQDVAQYAKISPAKITVTYEAADRITAAPQPVPRLGGRQFIMYVGRAMPHKNLARLIEAFEILKKSRPELMLVLAGKMDANYKRLEALASDKRLAGSVVFTDFVSEGQLRWLYENTQAYVFPSLSEGFGLPGLEAMMHGAPVVSSKATCLPEIYGNAAHYFDPTDVNDLARKVNDVLTKPDLRRQLVKNGQIRAAKYSWRKMAQKTLEIYKSALE